MFKASVELRNDLLEAMATGMNGGVLKMYDDTGSVPINASDAIGTSVLMVTVSLNDTGSGISFETDAASGVIQKKTTETWLGTLIASGTYSFFRFVSLTDDGSEDLTAKRLQGNIGLINSDINVSSMTKTVGNEQRIDSFVVGMPASAS